MRRLRLDRVILLVALVLLTTIGAGCQTTPMPQTPQSVVDELLAADRAAGAASGQTEGLSGLASIFATDVVMRAPGGFARGAAAVQEALAASPDFQNSRIEWAPIRGGISADGQHGFTFGFMTLTRADGSQIPSKYLSYWVKEGGQWKVIAYRRTRRAEGDVSVKLLPPALPAQLTASTIDAARMTELERELAAAEQAFSDEAQRIGLGPAFAKYGTADSMNVGSPSDSAFVIGNDAIAVLASAGEPDTGSSVRWSSQRTIVASSGDLGVSIGFIIINTPDESQPPPAPVPFFTVWRRASPDAPWRYVAE